MRRAWCYVASDRLNGAFEEARYIRSLRSSQNSVRPKHIIASDLWVLLSYLADLQGTEIVLNGVCASEGSRHR